MDLRLASAVFLAVTACSGPALAQHEHELGKVTFPTSCNPVVQAELRAAEASGDRENAIGYYTKLIQLASTGDGTRPELRRAKAYVARQ